jgi:hypothetical protein
MLIRITIRTIFSTTKATKKYLKIAKNTMFRRQIK